MDCIGGLPGGRIELRSAMRGRPGDTNDYTTEDLMQNSESCTVSCQLTLKRILS